jgi:hypothetical protein
MRQLLSIVAAIGLIAAMGAAVQAGPPLDGIYQSDDLPGGVLDKGRYAESWVPPATPLGIGNTLDAQSWDGASLGLEWRYWCAAVANVQLLTSTVNASGNGNETYMKTFVGGYIWLSGTGPWANGDPDYPGTIINYVEFETITYQNFVRIAAVANVQAKAYFDNYPSECVTFAIGNMAEMGTTDTMMKPANYPGFLDPITCNPTVVAGGWWDMFTLTLTITGCTVGTEETTWGAVKSLYR